MNKKIIALALVMLVVGTAIWFFLQTSARITQKKQVEANLQTLPNVQLVGLDSTAFGLRAWVAQEPVVVFYFDPTCEHCQNEAKKLKKRLVDFADTQLLWVSMVRLVELRGFEQRFGLEKETKKLKIVQISFSDAEKQFGFRVVPTILIYNSQQKLVKKFVGETKIEALVKQIKSV